MSRGLSTIYVGRVDGRTRERDLYDAFDRYGRVAKSAAFHIRIFNVRI